MELQSDLVVLTACNNARYTIQGILEQPLKLGLRSVQVHFLVHPNKDPGCLISAHEILRAQRNRYKFALVVFDREGCGQSGQSRTQLESAVQQRLDSSGWKDRSEVVVVDPELDVWVWSDSPVVEEVLGWHGRIPDLRSWLRDEKLLKPNEVKPERPKEALELAMREVRKRRTSAIYYQLASKVGYHRCSDLSFKRLCDVLRIWFQPKDGRAM